MAEKIRRNEALREYDIKEAPDGKQVVFSIKFIKKNGELVFLPRAVAAGLSFNMKDHRMRGVIAVDARGDKIGHVYPVNIDLITEWNGNKVVL
jgi:predicted metal-dependent enzyme (double-stranded beta helix superfamily)